MTTAKYALGGGVSCSRVIPQCPTLGTYPVPEPTGEGLENGGGRHRPELRAVGAHGESIQRRGLLPHRAAQLCGDIEVGGRPF